MLAPTMTSAGTDRFPVGSHRQRGLRAKPVRAASDIDGLGWKHSSGNPLSTSGELSRRVDRTAARVARSPDAREQRRSPRRAGGPGRSCALLRRAPAVVADWRTTAGLPPDDGTHRQ